ncbi:MAG TPA: MFS transporter [Steroidobacter sp.]|uniref:MFS transporter n=1 Tax=Steroidobacter sp. TaxID=1978227 RepID=UPI002EDAA7DA
MDTKARALAPGVAVTTWKHRYTILAIILVTYLISYLDRMVMATAIPFIAADLQLSPMAMGQTLSAFFAGYALMQIPGGLLADRFGPRLVLTASIALWSVMTAMTGMAAGLMAMLIIRVLFGVAEAPCPTAISKAVSQWFPTRELSRTTGLLVGATAVGASVAPIFVVALIANWGWRAVFYSLFVPGVVLALVVWRYVTNSPAESRHVTAQELADYDDERSMEHAPLKASLMQSLRTTAVLWCAASFFLVGMTNWGLLTWIPSYLLQARGFSAEKMGYFASLINLAGAVGFSLGGYLCDKYFRHNMGLLISIGAVLSGATTYFAATAASGEWAAVCFAAALLTSGFAITPILTLPLIVVPKHAVGGAFGIVNTAGQLAGLCSPLLIGYLLDLTGGNYRFVLYSLVACSLSALLPILNIRYSPGGPDAKGKH